MVAPLFLKHAAQIYKKMFSSTIDSRNTGVSIYRTFYIHLLSQSAEIIKELFITSTIKTWKILQKSFCFYSSSWISV